jgi:hypothetical protein
LFFMQALILIAMIRSRHCERCMTMRSYSYC